MALNQYNVFFFVRQIYYCIIFYATASDDTRTPVLPDIRNGVHISSLQQSQYFKACHNDRLYTWCMVFAHSKVHLHTVVVSYRPEIPKSLLPSEDVQDTSPEPSERRLCYSHKYLLDVAVTSLRTPPSKFCLEYSM